MFAIVTGAAGFIGSHLAQALLDQGWQVLGIDSLTPYYPRPLKEANLQPLMSHQAFRFREADIADVDWPTLLQAETTVFHLAAQVGVRDSWGDAFASYLHHNLHGLQRLLEGARQAPMAPRIVFASSSSIYGNAETLPTAEDLIPLPVSPYGVTKMAGERLGFVYHQAYGVPFTALRYFTVYGPRQRPDMALHRFMRALRRGEPVDIYGDGGQTRDLTFVSDIVAANLAAAKVDDAVGQAFNIGAGAPVSLTTLLDTIEGISGQRFQRRLLPAQAGDARHTGADITKAGAILGYVPQTDLAAGLQAMWAWSRILGE